MLPRLVPLLLCLGLLAAPFAASAGNTRPDEPLPPPDPSYAHLEQGADYRIGPLDKLMVNVFQVDELKTEVVVDASGNIDLPLVGALAASGKTTTELSAEISRRLSASYLQSPQVTVFVEEAESQHLTVGGEVNQPGVFDVHGRTTLMEAVAMAKGVTNVADLSHVTLFRTVNGQRLSATLDLRPVQKGRAADPEVYGDDIIMVGTSGFKSTVLNAGSLIPYIDLIPLLVH